MLSQQDSAPSQTQDTAPSHSQDLDTEAPAATTEGWMTAASVSRLKIWRLVAHKCWTVANEARQSQSQDTVVSDDDDDQASQSQFTEESGESQLTEGGERKPSISRWFGRYLDDDGKTKPLNNPHYGEVKEETVLTWLRHCMRPESRRDLASLQALASCLSTELSGALRNDAERGKLLQALPLTLEPSMLRSRLRLGQPIPGTRQGRTTVQLLPRYCRNHPALLYLTHPRARSALAHISENTVDNRSNVIISLEKSLKF